MNLIPESEHGLVAAIPNPLIIEIAGADAAKVVHNLCTNEILKLSAGECVESFVTDMRGWVVAHVMLVKFADRIVLLGSHEDPTRVINHFEKYIIREDARTADLSSSHSVLLLDGAPSSQLVQQLGWPRPPDNKKVIEVEFGGISALLVALPILSHHTLGVLILSAQREELINKAKELQFNVCSDAEFQLRRIANFWPLSPKDIREKTIPQELDRDTKTISFTKGCYLGQETIARLDARGQLQKKLCLIEIVGAAAGVPGDITLRGDKEVGQLTSVADDPLRNRTLALSFLRRGNFEVGTELTCNGRLAKVLKT